VVEKKSTQLRTLLAEPDIIVGPCVYDCISLRLVEEIGFKVAFHGGYNTAAPLYGMPDVGLITMTEMIGHARNLAAAAEIPVVCDVDDGFGDIINVIRTTTEVINSGLAGMYIEDQEFPKRCPAIGGGRVVSEQTMIRKLRAAIAVRDKEDPDFVVIARTHASHVIGMDEAIKRGVAYAKEGADIIFVDLCYSDKAIDELKMISEGIGPYAYVLANMSETVGRPLLTHKELQNMGFKIAYYPITAIITAAGALERVFRELKEKGTTRALVDTMMPFNRIGQLMGIDKIREQEKQFAVETSK